MGGPPTDTPGGGTPLDSDASARRRAEIGGGGLRARVAGGTVVNVVYLVGINVLTMVQGLLLAGLLGAREYGLWGLLAISFGTLLALAAVGTDDKYIQQDHPDQQVAFEIAFTLQLILCCIFLVLSYIAIPLFALLYDQPRIIVPGLLLGLAFPLIALQTPIWVLYRRMDFARQRVLESVSPVGAFVVTVGLALAGMGFWSLVIGSLAGAVAAAAASVSQTPYPLRLRYERGAMREYATFSWPLLVGSVSGILMFQIPLTIASRSLGAAAIGAITLASQITQYTTRVDDIVTHALYPAVCAVKDRADLLYESFSKSNRLAMLWGFPVGFAAALFAAAIIPGVLGDRWTLAVPLVEVLGLSAAVNQIGFNWTAFARARGETRILAVGAVVSFVAGVGVGVPLLSSDGLEGFAYGIGAATLANLAVRIGYLARLFPALSIVGHAARATLPTLVAAGAVVAERLASGDGATAHWPAEAAFFVVVVAIGTWLAERALLAEAAGYVRRVLSRARVAA